MMLKFCSLENNPDDLKMMKFDLVHITNLKLFSLKRKIIVLVWKRPNGVIVHIYIYI